MELVERLGVDVRGPSGEPAQVQAGEVVVFYFSAHWCPPCKQFTPCLAKVWGFTVDKSTAFDRSTGHGYTPTPPQRLHVIFVSSDKTEMDMRAYMAESHGRWSYVAFGTPGVQALSAHFSVQGIPSLQVCKPSGETINLDARTEVMQSAGNEDAAKSLVQRWRVLAGVHTDVIPCGVRVQLNGLSAEELNGKVCDVVGVDLATNRVRIRTSAGKVIAVRREACAQRAYGTLLADKEGGSPGEVKALSPGPDGQCKVGGEDGVLVAAEEVVPAVGTVVRIEGLQAKPEKNGTWGTVRSFDANAQRLEVEVSPSEVLKLRPANLRI